MFRLTAVLMLTAAPLAAQGFYGSARLSFGQSQTTGAPIGLQGAAGSVMTGRTDLTFGTRFDTGLYFQADLGLGATDNQNAAPNTANSSGSLVLRAGRETGSLSYGAFLGTMISDHDNDASDDAMRLLAGAEGSWALGSRWALDGHLGYLTGTSGTDSVATATDGVFTGLGLTYAVNDSLSLGSSIGYLNARMDAPATVVELWTLELRADYEIAAVPGLSLFAAAQYGESHQKELTGPDDITDTTSIMLGLTYRFGDKSPRTAKLSYLEPYLGNTGGVLE